MPHHALRWGVLGSAAIARKAVIPAIHAAIGNDVLAVASREAARAERFARDVGAPRAYGSYDDLLADSQVEAVYIPLPNALHEPWTIRAVEAGKHVLCEKPLAVSAAECRRMHDAADAAGVQLMEAFMYRHHPRTQRLIEVVQGGALGELRWLQASFAFSVADPANVRLSAELAGGALMDVGCYTIDVARALVGSEPHDAQAHATWAPGGVDETLIGNLRFDGGVVAQIACSLAAVRTEAYEVVGGRGRLRVHKAFLPGRDDCEALLERPGGEIERLTFAGVDQYQLMVEAFARAVRSGEPPTLGQDGALTLRVIEGLLASARAGGQHQALEPLPAG